MKTGRRRCLLFTRTPEGFSSKSDGHAQGPKGRPASSQGGLRDGHDGPHPLDF